MVSFGTRLRTARKMAGMSLDDLSKRIGGAVTRQAISKYEKALMLPSAGVLMRLTETLGPGFAGPGEPLFKQVRESQTRKADFAAAPAMPSEDVCCCIMEPPGLVPDRANVSARLQAKAEPVGAMAGLAARRNFRLGGYLPPVLAELERLPSRGDAVNLENAPIPKSGGLSGSKRRIILPKLAASQGPAPGLDQVRFREREKLPAKAALALKLRVADYVKRCLEIEAHLGIEQKFENPLAGRAVRSAEDVEAAARDVRRAWDLGSSPVGNLIGLMEDKGIRVFEVRGIEGFDGLSGTWGAAPFVTVSRDFPDDRVRFTAAHELGHLLCGFPGREGAESSCHKFAAAFLLPREVLEKTLMPARRKISLWEIGELKGKYGISLQAIMYRARSLGLVSDRMLRTFRETMKANGWIVTEPVEYRGRESASRLRRLLNYAVAENILDLERAAELAGVTAEQLQNEIGFVF